MTVIAEKLQLLANTKEELRVTLGIGANVPFSEYFKHAMRGTPGELFKQGEKGAWYDPSNPSTLYQDAAMTIPVTARGDPVGCMMDLSGNGNHAIQSVSASRPTYQTDGILHWLEGDGIDDSLIIPNSASTFKFMHDGTGGAVSAAVMSLTDDSYTQFISSEMSATKNVGFALIRKSRSDVPEEVNIAGWEIVCGVSNSYLCSVGIINSLLVDIPYVMRAGYKNNSLSDNAKIFVDSALSASTPTDLQPSVKNSTSDVALFGNISIRGKSRIYGVVLREGEMLGAEGENVDKYLALKSGVTL